MSKNLPYLEMAQRGQLKVAERGKGALAALNNEPRSANPHPTDSILWGEWMEGFNMFAADTPS